MSQRRFGALSSSQDPSQLANKVKGVVVGLSSVIIYLASQFFSIQLSADNVVELATQIGAVAGGTWAVYGSVLHLIALFYDRKNQG